MSNIRRSARKSKPTEKVLGASALSGAGLSHDEDEPSPPASPLPSTFLSSQLALGSPVTSAALVVQPAHAVAQGTTITLHLPLARRLGEDESASKRFEAPEVSPIKKRPLAAVSDVAPPPPRTKRPRLTPVPPAALASLQNARPRRCETLQEGLRAWRLAGSRELLSARGTHRLRTFDDSEAREWTTVGPRSRPRLGHEQRGALEASLSSGVVGIEDSLLDGHLTRWRAIRRRAQQEYSHALDALHTEEIDRAIVAQKRRQGSKI